MVNYLSVDNLILLFVVSVLCGYTGYAFIYGLYKEVKINRFTYCEHSDNLKEFVKNANSFEDFERLKKTQAKK